MKDHVIARRLRLIHSVKTPKQGVVNEILVVHPDHVTIQSERSGRPRDVWFEQIRNASSPTMTQNGVIIRTLATVLGIM